MAPKAYILEIISKVKIIRMTNSIYIRTIVTCVLSLAEEEEDVVEEVVLLGAAMLSTMEALVIFVVLVELAAIY